MTDRQTLSIRCMFIWMILAALSFFPQSDLWFSSQFNPK
jgi:hypothetical protein